MAFSRIPKIQVQTPMDAIKYLDELKRKTSAHRDADNLADKSVSTTCLHQLFIRGMMRWLFRPISNPVSIDLSEQSFFDMQIHKTLKIRLKFGDY
jgi:hypothetical protein